MQARISVILTLLLAAACGAEEVGGIEVTSPAFDEGERVPVRFTCHGEDLSPPLDWSGVPDGAAELRLTVTDPDAPAGTFTHWAVTGIDPAATGVAEGSLPEGGTEQENSFGETVYRGPCPPEGETHAYVWTVDALSEDGTSMASGTLTAEFGPSGR